MESRALDPRSGFLISVIGDDAYRSIDETVDSLIDHLERGRSIAGHNIVAFDLPWLAWNRPDLIPALNEFGEQVYDTLCISKIAYPRRYKHSLAEYGERFGVAKPQIEDFSTASDDEIEHRCREDVKITSLLWEQLDKIDTWSKCWAVYQDSIGWMVEMQIVGLPFDAHGARELASRMLIDQMRPLRRLKERLGDINFRSNFQIDAALREKHGRGLPRNPVTEKQAAKGEKEGSPCFNKDNSEAVVAQFPELKDLQRVNYLRGQRGFLTASSEKIYIGRDMRRSPLLDFDTAFASLRPVGTRTFRAEYAAPPLGQLAKTTRRVAVVPDGWLMIGVDLSGLEYSLYCMGLKKIMKRPRLWNELQKGVSFKKQTIDAMGDLMSKVILYGSETRDDVAKRASYARLYGEQPTTLAKKWNVPHRGGEIASAWNVRFDGIDEFTSRLSASYKNGLVTNFFGIRVYGPRKDILNTIIQSSASIYAMKIFSILYGELKDCLVKVHPIAFVKDELNFVTSDGDKRVVEQVVKRCVDRTHKRFTAEHGFPLVSKLNAVVGTSWKEVHL